MHRSFTYQNARRNKALPWFYKAFVLLLLLFGQTVSLFANYVDYYTSCGYVSAGSTVTATAKVSATNSSTNYAWQFRDNSNVWKCFVSGSNTINGVAFSVSGVSAKGQNVAPTLTIANSTVALNNVDVRLVMADGTNANPCASNPSYPSYRIYGTDKSLKLHVLTGSDCANIAAYCGGGTPALKLGDLIWNDINGNGVKDTDEPGVPKATVKLYADNNNDNIADGTAVATTATNASGLYAFSNLKSGNYIVGVIIPAGYTKGPASSIDPDNNINNDNNGVNLIGANQAGGEVRSKAITLSASGEPTTDGDDANPNLTLDIALCGNSELGDFVWNDKNANGIQDLNEPGIQGISVKLLFPDGATTRTTATDANGKYFFTALATGNYKITFGTPAGFTASSVNLGNNDAKDSDPINGNVNVTVAAGTSNLTIDAGFYVKVISNLSLGNQIWNDINGNGIKDADEPGVPDATVKLYKDENNDNIADGAAIATTTTNSNGLYSFSGLSACNYIVGVVIPSGYTKGPASTIDPDNNVDNDNNGVYLIGANQAGGEVRSKAITLSASGEPATDGDDANSNLTLDIALCGNSELGDYVWNDKNANGIQDLNEPGIQGISVKLLFPDGVTTRTTATDANGKYFFTALATGNYKITFGTPAGFTASPANQGNNDAKDSDPVNGNVNVTVASGTSNPTCDAGFYVKVISKLTLGNQVWNDFDGDGKRDENEPGIGGAAISLYTDNDSDNMPDGPAIKTTMSDAQGHYQFTNLAEGRYIASMPILPGYLQSPNDSAHSYRTTTLYPDNNVDDDNNLVRLVGPNGPGGVVYSNAITLTAGEEPITDGDGPNGNNTFDLAECGNSFIGDFVWNDLNGNGIQDAGEPGINDVLVTITFSDGRTASALTHKYDAANNPNDPIFDGYYNFPNLGPGTYKITFTTPAGLFSSPAHKGGNDAKDSDPVIGAPVTVTLAVNESNFTIDAGFTSILPPPPPVTCPNLSVGNMVFNDANGNGVKDANEQGIGGLTVKLYADNNGDNVADGAAISTVITAADGTYYFGNLAAGKYIVGVTTGSAYTQDTFADATPDDNKDNDNNGIKTVNGEVRSNSITLSSGDEPINDGSDNNSNLTLDFGLKAVPPCTAHCDCKNDCNHTDCGHPNCGHNSCKNDCKHTDCEHPNCGHNSCKNDCKHTDCGHPNCAHNSCKNDCKHEDCEHSNCGKKNNHKEGDDAKTEVSVFPNPATNYFQVKVDAIKSGPAQIRITDAGGHIVASKNIVISIGSNAVTFSDLDNLKSGSYNVQLLFNYHVYNEQLMLVK